MGRDDLDIEFGRYAEWLAEAALALELPDPVPAACRGTANPVLFERMADSIGARPGMTVLDLGCGIGGPGAWLATERGCNVIGVDLMEPGVRALKRLFPEQPAVVASSTSLPFPNARFDAVWILGVIELIADKNAALREVQRVLAPRGRVGLYTYVARAPLNHVPRADRFEPVETVRSAIAAAGLEIVEAERVELPKKPEDWRASTVAVRQELWNRHRGDPLLEAVEGELSKISRLCSSGDVEPWHFVLTKGAQ